MKKALVSKPKKLEKQWNLVFIRNDGKVFVADIYFKHKEGIEYTGIAEWTTGVTHKVEAELKNGEFSMVTAFPYTTPAQESGAARGMLFIGGEDPKIGVVNEMFLGNRVGIYKAERVVNKAMLITQINTFLLLNTPPTILMNELGLD